MSSSITKNNNLVMKLGAMFFAICLFQLQILSADQFSDSVQIMKDASDSGKQALGIGFIWAFGLFLPIACILMSVFLGYKFAKQKADQDKDNKVIFWALLISVGIGIFVDAFVTMGISKAMTGDSMKIFNAIWKFITSALDSAAI